MVLSSPRLLDNFLNNVYLFAMTPSPRKKPTNPSPPANPDGLTPRQRRFVLALPTAKSQTDAAIKAGYSPISGPESASENLRKPKVIAALAQISNEAHSAAVATIRERKEALTKVLRAPEAGPYPIQSVISASDQLNRMENIYVDKSVNLQAYVDLTALEGFTLDELKALLAKTTETNADDGHR